ncbi:MAG: hypothetical protein J6T35_02555 [Bacteroidales bacterium]|nr:hypothetical protein [Bacteroidales bacterium]
MSKAEQFFNGAYETVMQAPCTIVAGGHRYKVRQVAQAVKERIALLEQEAQVLEAKGKQGVPQKEARKLTKKLYSLHSKKAAYYLLGNWALFVPGLWALRWRLLQLRGNEVTFKINGAGAISEDMGFSKANWQLSRQERELYMRPVGDAAKQTQERLESVLNMLDADALGIKEENK